MGVLTDHDRAVVGVEVVEQKTSHTTHLFTVGNVVDLAVNLRG